MKINRNFLSGFSAWVALSVVSILFFQNCGQQGDIALKMEEAASDTLVQDICSVNPSHVRCTNEQPTGKVEEYRYIDVTQPVIPDLKIFLVLDNSDSMRVSQVNLMNNIEKMFSANSQGLQDYNSEIFILTTAQLNNIGNSLFRNNVDAKNDYQKVIEKIYEISSVQYVQNLIEVFRPADGNAGARKTTGLLEGDMVGFKVRTVRSPSSVGAKYDLVNADFSPAYLTHIEQPNILSVKYSKGESIQDLVDRVKARVEFLDPDKQFLSKTINYNGSVVDNVPLSDVVEKESGLCAMARVLHEVKNNPDNSLIKKGELATFILVSDEKEHDPSGLECVKSYKFQQPVPGFLYKGECADTDSNVSYSIPSDKTVTFKVKKPYTRHILWAYENIQPELSERMATCDTKFNQSLARLKVLKNTHVVTFDRKVVDADGDVVDYWKHDLKFDRVNLKHNLNFTRTTLKHKINFNRTSQKYAVTGKRTHTAPKYAVDIKRKKVAKYQRVNYKRETILKKEGNQTVVVETYTPPSPIRVSNVNFASPSQCTQDWLRTVPAVYSLEKTLSANESYKYTITECVINNDETADNKVVEVVGVKPTTANCNEALAKGVYPEGTLATNESFTYLSIGCLDRAATVVVANLNIGKDGVTPSVASCTPAFASSIDSSKPSVDAGKGETLVYSDIACADASITQSNIEIAGLMGRAPTSNLTEYVKAQDGNRANTTYSGVSATDTPVAEAGQKILVVGVAPSSAADIHNSIVAKDGNRANTEYSNESATAANVIDNDQTIVNIDGKYDAAVQGALASYIAVKDGNKANVSYEDMSVNNKATYKISLAVKVTVDGKTPTTCDVAYASSVDKTKPTLAAGQSLVYSNVSCSATSQSTYQLVRGANTIKYDGSYGHKAIPFESGLGTAVGSSRACSASELNAILTQEASASPALNIDGNVLVADPTNHCRVFNSEVTWADTNKSKIIAAINADAQVKYSSNASVCETAIATYCTNNSTNNPGNLLACENKPATYVAYRAFKPEYRKYSLKPPVKVDNDIHWFGFEAITTKNKSNVDVSVNLLNLTCSEVPGSCIGATSADDATKVSEYFKRVYANGDAAFYAAMGKVARSNSVVTDSVGLAACNGSFMANYSECRDKSVQYSNYLSYDDSFTDVAVAKGIDTPVSCNDVCTAATCKTKDASSFAVPFDGKTMNQFYNNACSIGSVVTTGTSTRPTAFVRLSLANSDNNKYQHDADVCSLTCAESGLCKLSANSEIDMSQMTVRQYLAAKNQNIDPAKVTSCKIVRNLSIQIAGKSSLAAVENECKKPAGVVLPNKYLRNSTQYYDADPSPSNEVKLVKENELNLENYIKNSFNNVLGDGYVNMIAFTSQNVVNGEVESADYNRIAASVDGQIRDVKASSSVYGDALKFLGEKVASQLASSFKVVDIDPSQQITRVWYSSWFTRGKFVELSPTDFSASANSFVITNPDIINKMKNEAAFKFFVEIY